MPITMIPDDAFDPIDVVLESYDGVALDAALEYHIETEIEQRAAKAGRNWTKVSVLSVADQLLVTFRDGPTRYIVQAPIIKGQILYRSRLRAREFHELTAAAAQAS
jgi:hypothetical protein